MTIGSESSKLKGRGGKRKCSVVFDKQGYLLSRKHVILKCPYQMLIKIN